MKMSQWVVCPYSHKSFVYLLVGVLHYRMGSRRDPQIRDDLDSVKASHNPHKIITRAVIELREQTNRKLTVIYNIK